LTFKSKQNMFMALIKLSHSWDMHNKSSKVLTCSFFGRKMLKLTISNLVKECQKWEIRWKSLSFEYNLVIKEWQIDTRAILPKLNCVLQVRDY